MNRHGRMNYKTSSESKTIASIQRQVLDCRAFGVYAKCCRVTELGFTRPHPHTKSNSPIQKLRGDLWDSVTHDV